MTSSIIALYKSKKVRQSGYEISTRDVDSVLPCNWFAEDNTKENHVNESFFFPFLIYFRPLQFFVTPVMPFIFARIKFRGFRENNFQGTSHA